MPPHRHDRRCTVKTQNTHRWRPSWRRRPSTTRCASDASMKELENLVSEKHCRAVENGFVVDRRRTQIFCRVLQALNWSWRIRSEVNPNPIQRSFYVPEGAKTGHDEQHSLGEINNIQKALAMRQLQRADLSTEHAHHGRKPCWIQTHLRAWWNALSAFTVTETFWSGCVHMYVCTWHCVCMCVWKLLILLSCACLYLLIRTVGTKTGKRIIMITNRSVWENGCLFRQVYWTKKKQKEKKVCCEVSNKREIPRWYSSRENAKRNEKQELLQAVPLLNQQPHYFFGKHHPTRVH